MRSHIRGFVLLACAGVTLSLFQNCSPAKFAVPAQDVGLAADAGSGGPIDQSNGAIPSIDNDNGSDGSPGLPIVNFDPDNYICYEITCTSLANRTQTLIAKGYSDNDSLLLTATAPSQKGAWVLIFSLASGELLRSENCWSDKAQMEMIQNGETAQDRDVDICLRYANLSAPAAPYAAFDGGYGNPFKSCRTPRPCK